MDKDDRSALLALPFIILVGAALAAAGSHRGTWVSGVPVFALSVAAAFCIQWLAFIPSWLLRTEKAFDLVGSVTYVLVTAAAVLLGPGSHGRAVLLLALVVVWAGRLGTFLFRRIHRAGRDDRFDGIKRSFPRFLSAWTLQGLWVTFTLAAALAAVTSTVRVGLGAPAAVGALIWLVGFTIEVVADSQKSRFRLDPANRDRFIATGLWAWSRHPNYFGEVVLWVGVAVIAAPALQGWQWTTLVSPLFVYLLLTRVSGVPLLERKAQDRWGGQADFQAYRANTPVLFPRPPRKR